MKPLSLDIVVRTFNEEDEIGECLAAVLKQREDFRKIIVVDNNSTDGTMKILEKLARRYSQIEILHEKNQGAEYARNRGFNHSRADVICMIDADTRILPGWARAVREFLTAHDGFAGCSGMTIYYDVPCRRFADWASWVTVFFANEVIGGTYTFYGANMAIRREAWRAIRDTVKTEADGKIMEDTSMSLALNDLGRKIGWAKEMEAHVSARRMRISPRRFWPYNSRWWRTYLVYGRKWQSVMIRVLAVWPANLVQIVISFLLRFHNPQTMRWSWKYFLEGFEERGFQ